MISIPSKYPSALIGRTGYMENVTYRFDGSKTHAHWEIFPAMYEAVFTESSHEYAERTKPRYYSWLEIIAYCWLCLKRNPLNFIKRFPNDWVKYMARNRKSNSQKRRKY